MVEPPPKPPFDPLWGAWVVLLVLLFGLYNQLIFNFIGCAVFREPTMCAHSGEGVRDVALEVLTAVAVLIAARRKD